jgi:hypothetical protein
MEIVKEDYLQEIHYVKGFETLYLYNVTLYSRERRFHRRRRQALRGLIIACPWIYSVL